jgi:hypothetical protein
MNERIRELLKQATKEVDPYDRVWVFSKVDQAKFAELIIQECATAFEAEVDTWKEMDPYQGSMKRKGTQAIKQHFGVEQ